MEASYCLCGRPYDPNIFMIQCDACKDWFHGSCANFQEHLAVEIDRYYCPRCSPLYGPAIYKPYRNWHRHDFWEENVEHKPVQTGTPVFIRELRARHFANENDLVVRIRGQQLTETLLVTQGFDTPIVIDNKDGLDMTMPPENFSLYDVESYIGGDYEMDVIDVTRQTDIKMKLKDFVGYFNTLNRTKVYNVISLEFSNTGLSRMIEAPSIARKLDWVNTVWPRDYPVSKPHVQKYCLMSVKDAYTDFHIDFGGTSVWYHVLRGEKIFYLIKPTPANITLYQQWMTSSNQSETFFGDQVDQCYKCTIKQGQTMLIPTGWIHAVLTTADSLVFGGNFLHSINIPMQLQVYEIEKKVKTTEKFMFPNFEMINWFAAQKLCYFLHEINKEERKCPTYIFVGLKALVVSLKQWNSERDLTNSNSRNQIPHSINSSKILKDISKELRHAERISYALNPPKPERESKRKRKKPVNKDFVDYSLTTRSNDFLPASIPNFGSSLTKGYPFNEGPIYDQDESSDAFERSWSSDDMPKCHQATAVHRGGAILKFKLGNKEILPVNNSQTSLEMENELLLPNFSKSIYDFHDDSDRDDDCFNLSIDENPKRKKVKQSPELSPVKIQSQTTWCIKNKKNKDSEVDVVDLPKNGIESLIKASALTNKFIDESSGRTSPSTQEAIAGMLSISQTYVQPGRSPRTRKPRTSSLSEEDDLNNVHQDEDYIYPSLDNSDDDDVHIFKPRGRSKIDEAWNPKARVGPLLPKMNRPAREGTKKQAVEKVLEAAAAKRAADSPEKSPKRQYRRKKIKPKIVEKVPIATTSASSSSASLSTVSQTTPPPSKPKKGMKTVKQRLGKILKLHKMRH